MSMHTAEVQAAGDSNTGEGYRKLTYLSGNSTGSVLILLCKANMFSSINGHWSGEGRETKERQWIVPEFSCQENKNSNGLQAYIHLYKWTGRLPRQDKTIVSIWQAHVSLRWLCSRENAHLPSRRQNSRGWRPWPTGPEPGRVRALLQRAQHRLSALLSWSKRYAQAVNVSQQIYSHLCIYVARYRAIWTWVEYQT